MGLSAQKNQTQLLKEGTKDRGIAGESQSEIARATRLER